MQNEQTEPKLYMDTTKALFVHSKKNLKKRKADKNQLFYNILNNYILLFFAICAIFTPQKLFCCQICGFTCFV